ncbi:MAG: hypothetical protein K2J83_03955 [Clostridia bacterium]|nr:hypothetical protein [Clostridia bacterium]
MTNLKISAKMHIMVIVSAVIIALGIAVGCICHFLAGGYFNFSGEYSSYKSVTVSYVVLDYGDEDELRAICDEQFDKAGVNYYNYSSATDGYTLTFKFSESANTDKIKTAVDAINGILKDESAEMTGLSSAVYHTVKTELGGGNVVIYGSIALAASVVFQFIYFAIRYKLTMALSALLADVHNLAIFVCLLSLCRVPVSSSIVVFATITVLMTMIGCCFLFDRARKNGKDEQFTKLSGFEQVDTCVKESFMSICVASVCVAAAAVVLFVLLSISALSVVYIAIPILLGLVSAVSCLYGTAFFTPAVYSRFKRIGEKFKTERKKSKKA